MYIIYIYLLNIYVKSVINLVFYDFCIIEKFNMLFIMTKI